jgi:hypothetical protein
MLRNKRVLPSNLVLFLLMFSTSHVAARGDSPDWRAFEEGHRIYSSGYIDQPYVVVLDDGSWLCVFTTGVGREGQAGQHVVSSRTVDQGRTWSAPIDIEPADGPTASWAMPYRTRYNRVYVFYDYNGEQIDTLNGRKIRDDVLGWYCYKFSDDGGRSWSARYRLPMRVTECDRGNDFEGAVQLFWGIDKADDINGGMMFAFTKLGKYILDQGEGWFYRCDNIHTERDPSKLAWQLLPEGERGLRNDEFGSVQEEHNLVPLSDGSLYCVYRTCTGYPAESYSRDGGKTWSEPRRMRYADSTPIKNPRACPRLFRCRNGRFLFWFHNHSGTSYEGRNPAWLAGGIEKDGRILWSQAEILIYGRDTPTAPARFSYPDLIEHAGRYWITCTNKVTGRVHEIPAEFVEGLWSQFAAVPTDRYLPRPFAACSARDFATGTMSIGSQKRGTHEVVGLHSTADTGGFSVDLTGRFDSLEPNTMLWDARDELGKGVHLVTKGQKQIEIVLTGDGQSASWTSDPGALSGSHSHRVTVIVDNGPKIISWIVDGRLCDGGDDRQFGWARYPSNLGSVFLASTAKIATENVTGLQVFNRPLRTSEAVALHRADN